MASQASHEVGAVVDLLLDAPFRALPVVDTQGRLLGIISTGGLINVDVLPMRRSQPLTDVSPQQQPVSAYVSSDVATVREQMPLFEVIDALTVSLVKRVVVVNNEHKSALPYNPGWARIGPMISCLST